MNRRAVLWLSATAFALVGGPALAEAEAPTTTVAPTTMAPTTVAAPSETTIAVADEAQYRAALTALSVDASGPHTIDLSSAITVDDGTDPTYTGTEALTLDGHGFTLDAAGSSRLLVVDSPTDAAVTLTDVSLRDGSAAGDGGAVLVLNASTLHVADSRFAANHATGSGGAIEVPLVALVERSTFAGNVAVGGDGGAIDAAAVAGELTTRESLFTGNRAPSGDGGAISAIGFGFPATGNGVQRSTFVGNRAQRGGALVMSGGAVLDNSTFVGNTASVEGGGIAADGGSAIGAGLYLTLAGNSAPSGANLFASRRELRFLFSVFAEPTGGGANCAPVGGQQFTLIHADDDSCGAANNGGPALLGPLGDHGGRTATRVPSPGSPLIDVVPVGYGFPTLEGGCARFLTLDGFDQRGVERPQDGDGETRPDMAQGEPIDVAADCDVGAVEAAAVVTPPTGPVAVGPSFTG